MRISDGWFVLYQPKYRIPSVFDLHRRGLFRTRPFVTKEYGARLLVSEELCIRIQHLCLTQDNTVKDGVTYSYISKGGFIDLADDLSLNQKALAEDVAVAHVRDEITKIHGEWYESYVPLNQDGVVDRAELERKLEASVRDGKKRAGEELIRQNSPWIKPVLPRMRAEFRYGLYERVSDKLYSDYRERGGKDTEDALIDKILLFDRIYESEDLDALVKPDGSKWGSDREMWACWEAFTGSESESRRIFSTMKTVFPPVQAELSEELGIQ